MAKDKTGKELPAEAFMNEGETRDPKKVDSSYSAEYLTRRDRWVETLKKKLGRK